MSEQANLDVMRRAVEAFRAGDVGALHALFAPDVAWHVPGKSPLAKDYRGRAEVFGFFGRLMNETAGTFRLETVEMLANAEGGVYVDRVRAERKGRMLDVMLLLRVSIAGGRITGGWDCFHQEHVWDSFFD